MKKYLDIIYFNRKEIIIVIVMLLGFISFTFFSESNNDYVIEESIEKEEIMPEKIIVDIKGEVNSPGSYEIDQGKRIKDIIEIAGGLKDDASTDNINLSSKLTDEMLIVIPKKEEEKDTNNQSIVINSQLDNKISINTANLNELMSISGIGKTKAQSIIDYRINNGRFNSINDIMNVSGIGKSTFEKIKDYIKV